jgi:ribose transport system substrate-binding protein
MRTPSASLLLCLLLAAFLSPAVPARAERQLYVIVAKSVSDANFHRVYDAAREEARRNGDRVILTGGEGKAHFRLQDRAVREALRRKPDGLAISVLRSRYLAENSFRDVARDRVPVVTFDSDFTEKYRGLRTGYIGTDNVELGRVLGRETIRLRPSGGTVAVMIGGLDDTNLNDRIQGLGEVLDLGREACGWRLDPRSPLPCRDSYPQALEQLQALLEDPAVDVIVSVGWWAQMSDGYEQLIRRHMRQLDDGTKIVIFAGAHPTQLALFRKGLSHVNIGLDFEEMGRLCYRYLAVLAGGGTVPAETWTGFKVYRRKDR